MCKGLCLQTFNEQGVDRLYARLYVLWSSDARDSSAPRVRHQSTPRVRGVVRQQMAALVLVVGCPCLLLSMTLTGYRHGKWVIYWLVRSDQLSFQHTTVSSDESQSGVDAPPVNTVLTSHRFSSRFWERTRLPAFVFIAVRQPKLTLMMG